MAISNMLNHYFIIVNYIIGATQRDYRMVTSYRLNTIKNFVVIDDYPLGMEVFKDKYIRINQNRLLDDARDMIINSFYTRKR